jgi:hypothetical protein
MISYPDFLEQIMKVKQFNSSRGRRYEMDGLRNDIMFFRRIDAGGTDWNIDLKQLYRAYTELETFETENFRPYVPQRHSPGRGLLLHLGLIV